MVDCKRKKIWDQQWKNRKPKEWHSLMHQRHREVLLGPDEDIEQLISCHFGSDPHPLSGGIPSSPVPAQLSIAVATQNRIICVAKGIFSKVTRTIDYRNVKTISHHFAPTTGEQVMASLVTGNFNSLMHSLGPLTGRCRIEEYGVGKFSRKTVLVNIMPRETAEPFVEYVQSRVREM